MPPAWLVTLCTTARVVVHFASALGHGARMPGVIAVMVPLLSCSHSVALSVEVDPPLVCRQYRTHVFAGSDVWKMKSYPLTVSIVFVALNVGFARLRSWRDARSIATRASCVLSCWRSTARLERY